MKLEKAIEIAEADLKSQGTDELSKYDVAIKLLIAAGKVIKKARDIGLIDAAALLPGETQ